MPYTTKYGAEPDLEETQTSEFISFSCTMLLTFVLSDLLTTQSIYPSICEAIQFTWLIFLEHQLYSEVFFLFLFLFIFWGDTVLILKSKWIY